MSERKPERLPEELPKVLNSKVSVPLLAGAQGCARTVFQKANVCTVVTVTPDAFCGPVSACCVGDPVFSPSNVCLGSEACVFTVSQELCLTIPITFNANAVCSAFTIDCEPPSLIDCTPECTP